MVVYWVITLCDTANTVQLQQSLRNGYTQAAPWEKMQADILTNTGETHMHHSRTEEMHTDAHRDRGADLDTTHAQRRCTLPHLHRGADVWRCIQTHSHTERSHSCIEMCINTLTHRGFDIYTNS